MSSLWWLADWTTKWMNEWTNEWTNEQTTNPLYCCWRSQLRLHSQMVNDTLESVTSSGCTVTSYYMVCSYAFCCCWFVIRPVLLLQYYELDESTIIYTIMWKVNDTSVGQRKNLSPRQESNAWPPKHMAGAPPFWATRTRGEQGHLTEFICGRRPAFCYTYSVCKMVRFIYFGFFFKGI